MQMISIQHQSLLLLIVVASIHCVAVDALRRPPVLAGSFGINHRHGGDGYGDSTSSPDAGPTPDKIVDDLARILSSENLSSERGDAASVEKATREEAQLWRRLGKLRLDAGEYAEAPRIFRRGSARCPNDEGLRHHVTVFDAFHGTDLSANSANPDDEEGGDAPEPLRLSDADRNKDDLFLSLDVPPDKVPKPISDMAGEPIDSGALTKLIHASTQPLLSREACQFLVQSAEDAVKRRGGWTTDRHIHAPTCDVPAFDLQPAAVRWIQGAIRQTLFPLIASSFPRAIGIEADNLRIQDLFVVRYDGEGGDDSERVSSGPGFASLRPHEDESLVSLTIALNDMAEYEGGGLFVACTGDLLNGDTGTVLCFAGGLVHGGYPVSRGTRWIMTVFLYVDKNLSGREPGYTLRCIEDAKERKEETQ